MKVVVIQRPVTVKDLSSALNVSESSHDVCGMCLSVTYKHIHVFGFYVMICPIQDARQGLQRGDLILYRLFMDALFLL